MKTMNLVIVALFALVALPASADKHHGHKSVSVVLAPGGGLGVSVSSGHQGYRQPAHCAPRIVVPVHYPSYGYGGGYGYRDAERQARQFREEQARQWREEQAFLARQAREQAAFERREWEAAEREARQEREAQARQARQEREAEARQAREAQAAADREAREQAAAERRQREVAQREARTAK